MGKKPQKRMGPKTPVHKSRKETRKEQRKEKKIKRSMRNAWRNSKPETTSTVSGKPAKPTTENEPAEPKLLRRESQEMLRNDEKSKQTKLQSEMQKSRKKQLLVANEEEDRNIRHLEKLLRLNRRKGTQKKSLPKSFASDGLGYLLEVCDPDTMKESVKVDQALQDSGSEFEEDFAFVTGKNNKSKKQETEAECRTSNAGSGMDESDDDSDSNLGSGSDFGIGLDDGSDDDMSAVESDEEDENDCSNKSDDSHDGEDRNDYVDEGNDEQLLHTMDEDSDVSSNAMVDEDNELEANLDQVFEDDEAISYRGKQYNSASQSKQTEEKIKDLKVVDGASTTNSKGNAKKIIGVTESIKVLKRSDLCEEEDDFNEQVSEHEDMDLMCDNEENSFQKTLSKKNPDGTWEDIYGRTRDTDGNVVDAKSGKYIPPALRAKLHGNEDAKRKESLARLRKQMKGLINRLAENNMTSICNQMDELFMKNSRNDMNETLLHLFMDVLVSHVLTPERLVMEHMLLVAVLHANVGSEIGAHFLQNMMKRFHEMLDQSPEVENKHLDNIVLILSHMYNFKIFSASLMYEVLDKIAEKLDEKRIELLLVILRSVGFSLRKDDPLALKSLIVKLQSKAVDSASSFSSTSRIKFMLDILMAIKNNNISKIPSYSPEHVEHLKKLLRNLIRRGNYVAELKISLHDLLEADERGRWWIVGSAWTGHLPGESSGAKQNLPSVDLSQTEKASNSSYSSQLLEMARKQRMNTGVRKDIFCILMTAEDYLDAFEKLLHLNLKNQQRQEIVHVLFDCCLQEKSFNPYYAHLCQKFCEFDRQYQMKYQYCLWDKVKELDKLSNTQLSNMAKLLAHLFLEKGLPISALKVMSFAEMDKPCVRLVRQILLSILLSEDVSKCQAVFLRIAPSPQLHLFREGLRLFINHFVLRKGSSRALHKKDFELLQERAKVANKAMSLADARTEF